MLNPHNEVAYCTKPGWPFKRVGCCKCTVPAWLVSQRHVNHVGALLYKCMQQKTEEISSTSKPNKWLPARKTVPPVPVSELVFKVQKLDKCNSKILPLKQFKQRRV